MCALVLPEGDGGVKAVGLACLGLDRRGVFDRFEI